MRQKVILVRLICMIKALKLIIIHALRVNFNIFSIWEFIYLNFASEHVDGDYREGNVIIPYPNCEFDFKKGSIIKLKAPLALGIPSMRNSKKISYLFMNENAKIIVNNNTSIIDGYDIQIHKEGLLEMDSFHSNTGLEVSCGNHIKLEGEVTCGRHVRIKDFNGHYVSYNKYPISAPIFIHNHTWLCTGSNVGPGVTIGEGSVIADNSNVICNIPIGSFCSGNPAVVVAENIEFKI